MGSPVGTYDDDEVNNLSPKDREELKRRAVQTLLSSAEIRAIIKKNPTVLARDRKINKVLRQKLDPVLKRLKRKPKRTYVFGGTGGGRRARPPTARICA
jgi:hypothetical protein